MLINIGLLVLVFGAKKKNISPYIAALLLGAAKGAIYFLLSRSVVAAVGISVIYAGLASGFVYFLKRLDKREDAERPETPVYRSAGSETIKFKWEYIPISMLLVLIIIGG